MVPGLTLRHNPSPTPTPQKSQYIPGRGPADKFMGVRVQGLVSPASPQCFLEFLVDSTCFFCLCSLTSLPQINNLHDRHLIFILQILGTLFYFLFLYFSWENSCTFLDPPSPYVSFFSHFTNPFYIFIILFKVPACQFEPVPLLSQSSVGLAVIMTPSGFFSSRL